jgi:hypothetical protein
MSITLKNFWNTYGIGTLIVLLLVAYGIYVFINYLDSKSSFGSEKMTTTPNDAYSNQMNNTSKMLIVCVRTDIC